MKKKLLSPIIIFLLILVSCSFDNNYPWDIEVRSAEIKNELHTDAGVPQYDGSILNTEYKNVPDQGFNFLILTLTITKDETSKEIFDWKNLSIIDNEGNTYTRMENDTFLSSHTYNRLPGTSLMIGENKGSICFNINNNIKLKELTLQYDFGDGIIFKKSLGGL